MSPAPANSLYGLVPTFYQKDFSDYLDRFSDDTKARRSRNLAITILTCGLLGLFGGAVLSFCKILPGSIIPRRLILSSGAALYACKILGIKTARSNYYQTLRVKNLLQLMMNLQFMMKELDEMEEYNKKFIELFVKLVNAQAVLDLNEMRKNVLFECFTYSMIAGSSVMIIGGMFTAALAYQVAALAMASMVFDNCYHSLNDRLFYDEDKKKLLDAKKEVKEAYHEAANMEGIL